MVPVLDGDATKAIPIIKDEKVAHATNPDDTIVHQDKPKDMPKKKNKGKKIAIWIMTIFFLLAAAGVAAFTVIPSLFLPKDVTVPDVTNKSYEAAYRELDSLGFALDETKEVFDSEIEEGKVVRTDPKAGVTTKEGAPVVLYVSKGKETEEIENYIGQNFEDISSVLANKFKEVKIESQSSPDKPAGEILDQFPKSGAYVLEEQELTLFVSTGPPTFQLGNLVGYTIRQVENYVAERGLILEKVNSIHSADVERDYIISQKPAPGTELKSGDKITVDVSKGPEPTPKPVTREVTVQYQPTEEGKPQSIEIYVEDMENELTGAPVITDSITADKKFVIKLIIPYEGSATYKVQRDGTVIIEKTVLYNEE
jgi:serine/threonine-protein kinase